MSEYQDRIDPTKSIQEITASRLGRIEGKLDMLVEVDKSAHADIHSLLKDHDKRIKALESKVWWVTGAWATIVTAVSAYLAGAFDKVPPSGG